MARTRTVDINNSIQRNVRIMQDQGFDNERINVIIDRIVADQLTARIDRGETFSRYTCSCNNWGPRFIENSLSPCCAGCFNWALDHHYEVPTSDLDPNRVTTEMIENNTWGIRADVVKRLRAERLIDKALTETTDD